MAVGFDSSALFLEGEPVGDRACFENSAHLVRGVGIETSSFRRFCGEHSGCGPGAVLNTEGSLAAGFDSSALYLWKTN